MTMPPYSVPPQPDVAMPTANDGHYPASGYQPWAPPPLRIRPRSRAQVAGGGVLVVLGIAAFGCAAWFQDARQDVEARLDGDPELKLRLALAGPGERAAFAAQRDDLARDMRLAIEVAIVLGLGLAGGGAALIATSGRRTIPHPLPRWAP